MSLGPKHLAVEPIEPVVEQHRVCVVVCTRNRPELLRSTLDALARQSDQGFELIIINQGEKIDTAALDGRGVDGAARLIDDGGHGISRARNLAWRQTEADWVVFVDDDCLLQPDWISTLKLAAAQRPDCCCIVGQVSPINAPPGPYLPTGVVRVRREQTRRGRWRPPLSLGQGVCMAIRRQTLAALGGWDERLGPGSRWIPAAEDEDFNYRMLRDGGAAFATPALRAWHQQWRTRAELVSLFHDYMIGRGAVAMKHVRSSDAADGTWLLSLALIDCCILLGSAVRFGLRFRLAVGRSSLSGLLAGVRRGWREAW